MVEPRPTIVVGAGIVGLCTAIELRRRGRAVLVLDRVEPAHGCSYGNAGILAAQAVVPVALPGLLGQLPAMLLKRESPLRLRWGALPRTAPWLWRTLRGAQEPAVRRAAAAMKALYGSTVERHRALAAEAGVPELVREAPGLYVHRSPSGIDLVNGLAWQLRQAHGAQIEVLEGSALREAEPALSPAYTRAVRMGPMGHSVNPLRLAQAYAALLRRLGGEFQRTEVRALRPNAGAGVAVHTHHATLQAEAVVVAAGAWTPSLLRPLGLALPLVAERGYHLTFADPGITLRHVVSEVGDHVACTSMEPGLRIAGTEEIGLPDQAADWRRAEQLRGPLARLFPQARLAEPTRWMGPRPGLPDSLPAIGAVPGAPGVFVAAGHGHLGLTGAPHTGALVAQLVCAEDQREDLTPFDPGRFQRTAS
jgi:D-amino-acid dehydrogenase